MLKRWVHSLIVLCLLGSSAAAGPWLRAPGTQFLSLSVEASKDTLRPETYGSIYYEYGLRPKLTLGLDAGRDSWGQSSALIFARLPLWLSESGSRAAADFAIGQMTDSTGTYLAIRPGLSWGRALKWGQGGWLSIDATYAYVPETTNTLAKIEGTLGLNHSDRVKYLLQLIAEKPTGQDTLVSATPGLAWRFGKGSHLLGGVILRSDGSTTLKLGLWRDF